MTDHDSVDGEAHADDHGSHEHDEIFDRYDEHGDEGRVTSPMQPFESSQVTTGLVVLAAGLLVVFAVPILL